MHTSLAVQSPPPSSTAVDKLLSALKPAIEIEEVPHPADIDPSTIDRMLQFDGRWREALRRVLLVAVPIVTILATALYAFDPVIFFFVARSILDVLWESKATLFSFVITTLGGGVIHRQTVKLRNVSAQSVSEINIAAGKMHEAAEKISASTDRAQSTLAGFNLCSRTSSSIASIAGCVLPQHGYCLIAMPGSTMSHGLPHAGRILSAA